MNDYSYLLFGVPTILLIIFLLAWLPHWQTRKQRNDLSALRRLRPAERIQLEKDLSLAENSFRTTLAQILGGLVILGTLFATYQSLKVAQDNADVARRNTEIAQDNLQLSEQGKLTDRFSKAVELLGNDKLDVRLGGIYALERISNDSQKDHWAVMEVLTAFVRENSTTRLDNAENLSQRKKLRGVSLGDPLKDNIIKLREDVQAVMTVIGRRKWSDAETKSHVLDFRDSYLMGVNLENGNFARANFTNVIFGIESLEETGRFRSSNLRGVDLSEATLGRANLYLADLTGANLRGARLMAARMKEVKLAEADLTDTNLQYAMLLDIEELAKSKNIEAAILGDGVRKQLNEFLIR
jgi:uncharacterized protein YjbI with pentapeptide repeats